MADTGQGYKRPAEGFRLRFEGIKTNAAPDSLPPGKYPYAQNVRALQDSSVRGRWGITRLFPTSSAIISAIRAYTTLGTDDLPQLLAAGNTGSSTEVWLGKPGNTSALVGSLARGTGVTNGTSMIPFRPAQSPNPWMYIANGSDYQKFSAPAVGTGAVTQQKVGIAEPQFQCEAVVIGSFNTSIIESASFTLHADIASAPVVQSRLSDTIQSIFPDPAGTTGPFSVTIGTAVNTGPSPYTKQMAVIINGDLEVPVQDVFPALTTALDISSIYYFVGTTGRCVIVPSGMPPGPGDGGESIYTQNLTNSLRRGGLIKFSTGETALVWNVTEGPDGTICIETSTTGTHTSAETFTCPPAISVVINHTLLSVGQTITSPTVGFNLSGAGIGTITTNASLGSIFVNAGGSFQPEDYIHISVAFVTLASLNEFKFLLDVGDGSFTQNFYYYTARVSDIEAAVQNTLTQLGAAQLVSQRATIDEEQAAASNNQLSTASSAQTTPGDGQWAEIVFPISALTRVGNDQTKSLQNLNAAQFLFNMNAATDASVGDITIFGQNQPDVGQSGAPYLYRARPRSSVTGVKGNPTPTMRYGVNPRRAGVTISLPSATYDPQIDTWDVFRYGGSVTSWRKIGQTAAVANATFYDNYSDYSALAGEVLELDNLEPWPTIDIPLTATTVSVSGTAAVVSVASPTNVLRYLPGNLVQIGGINVYTLRVRPTLISGTNYLFQFVENAGTQGAVPLTIYEPDTARQFLPYMWGPDSEGTVFAVGDPLRLGGFSTCKPYAPDAAPDAYNQELCPPSEPLLGGEIIDGLSYVASTERWWALYPQLSNPAQRYSAVQQPLTRGLAAPFGHWTDGKHLYWWAKDSIQSSAKGSLTDADLYNIFPHDGVPGGNATYNGNTVYAPDYTRASAFRLSVVNNYLYAIYQDTNGIYRTLVLDLVRMAWSVDVFPIAYPPTVIYQPEQQSGGLLSLVALYPLIAIGTVSGQVYQQQDLANDDGIPIACVIATNEWDGGDIRAGEQWGDLWAYLTPAAAAGVVLTPMSLGAPVAAPTTIPSSASVVQTPVSLGGELLSDFMGAQFAWTDDYSTQTAPTVIQAWQPSFIPKPETITDRFTDWYDGGTEEAKYIQGFRLHADTFNAVKGLVAVDSDTLSVHAFSPAVQQNGESISVYSFNAPFIAHLVRLQSQDQVPWRFFDLDLIHEPTAEAAETWQTQGTAHGLQGYMHLKQVSPCYASTQPITLTITSFDGQSPQPIVLPATGGAMQKIAFMCTANKGQVFFYKATSSAPFQLFLENWEIEVGGWQRQDNYLRYRNLGGPTGDQARV